MEYYWWVVLLLIPVLWLAMRRTKKKPARQVLFYGPCDSGKTFLFHLLTQNEAVETVSSMKVNEGHLTLPRAGEVSVKDIPGHQIFLEDLIADLPNSQAVVFLVDSSDKLTFKEAAKQLDILLTTAKNAKKSLSLLIFCNKQDKPFCKRSVMIESELSTELERLRMSKKALSDDEETIDIGLEGTRFDFEHCKEYKTVVEFREGSLKSSAEGVLSFIRGVFEA